MNYSKDVEFYKTICEKLIDDNPNYNETTKMQLKAIVKSNDCGEIVLKRLATYFSVKGS